MKKFLLYANIIVLMGCCCSCISNNDKCLRKLFEETGIESSRIKPASFVLFVVLSSFYFFLKMLVLLAVTFYLCYS